MNEIKPEYYHQNGTDVIEMIERLRGKQAAKEFCIGNVVKYTIRFDRKNGVEDLQKAQTYISRLMEMENQKDASE